MVFKEGDLVRVKERVPNYQLGATDTEINSAVVVTPKVPPKNLGESALDFVLGDRVRVKFLDENLITRVRSRDIIGTVPETEHE